MMITTTARRVRSAAALCAAVTLLGLTACVPDGDVSTEPGNGPGADEGAGQDDSTTDDPGAVGDRTRIMLITEFEVDDGRREGSPILLKEDLAALLVDRFGGTAECLGGLVIGPDHGPTRCTGPSGMESSDSTQDWIAYSVWVRNETGFQSGSSAAVLFQTGTELPEGAMGLLEDDVVLTGVGVGSMYGAEPLSAEQVAEGVLSTLTSENAYGSVAGDAEWADVSCEEGLDFTDFRTVPCRATTADDDSWDLVVAPGSFADNDQGLLVGIRTGLER